MIKTHLFFDVTFRYNYRGQLGLGTTASVFVPQLVRGLRYGETWRTFISVERNFTVYSQCNILIPIFFFFPLPSSTKRVETVSCSYYHSVREVFVVHVGGTRCVPSSTDNTMKIHARTTLTGACIRTCLFFLFLVDVDIQGRV